MYCWAMKIQLRYVQMDNAQFTRVTSDDFLIDNFSYVQLDIV